MTEGKYYDLEDANSETASVNPVSTDNKFGEALTYDKRGNILSLQRNGMIGACSTPSRAVCGTFGQIDALDYSYNDKNQITKIFDNTTNEIARPKGFKAGNFTDTQYTYDAKDRKSVV